MAAMATGAARQVTNRHLNIRLHMARLLLSDLFFHSQPSLGTISIYVAQQDSDLLIAIEVVSVSLLGPCPSNMTNRLLLELPGYEDTANGQPEHDMTEYYTEKLSGRRLQRCYDVALAASRTEQ